MGIIAKFFIIASISMFNSAFAKIDTVPKEWNSPVVPMVVSSNTLYLPISHQAIKALPI